MDWLITNVTTPVTVMNVTSPINSLQLSNGLISRQFVIPSHGDGPEFGTVGFWSHVRNASVLRAFGPEAKVELDGYLYDVGGLTQPSLGVHSDAWLNYSVPLAANDGAFTYVSHSISPAQETYPWTPGRRGAPFPPSGWPPRGQRLSVEFKAPSTVKVPAHAFVQVTVVYEIIEGIPLMSKWLEVSLGSGAGNTTVEVTACVVEWLQTYAEYSPMALNPQAGAPWQDGGVWAPEGYFPTGGPLQRDLHMGMFVPQADLPHVSLLTWQYGPQTSDSISSGTPGAQQPVLNATYLLGPGFILTPASSHRLARKLPGSKQAGQFVSYRVIELVTDTTDATRAGLMRRQMVRRLWPATTEAPLYLSMTNTSLAGVENAVDQAVSVGFDMLLYSFGTGFNFESTDPSYRAEIKQAVDYAKSKGIEMGGYDLIVEDRNVGSEWQVVNPGGGFGGDACFASGWYDRLTFLIDGFLNDTGLSAIITDGPYGGDHLPCASTNHSHHLGLSDSVFWQTYDQVQFYAQLLSKGVYILQPDYYFGSGAQISPCGYNEQQFSLPRWLDVSVTRASLLGGDLNHYIPSQCWSFLPLVQYHAGGAAAAFEPLTEHFPEYEFALGQMIALGLTGNLRGDRFFDTEETQEMVTRWVQWRKRNLELVSSDVIPIRHPDMFSVDAALHVNPFSTTNHVGLLLLFNPTTKPITTTLNVDLYYTGLETTAQLQQGEDGTPTVAQLARDYTVPVTATVPPQNLTYVYISRP